MEPLYGSRLKVGRAKAKIEKLIKWQDAFRQDSTYHLVRSEFNPETGQDVYRVGGGGPPLSDQWPIEIGEIAHNLRSALNYIIYQLALLKTIPETVASDRAIQFPIFTTSGDFGKKSRRMIRLLEPEHQTLIEGLQPYEGRYVDYPLFWLEEINNADKHRLIQVVRARIGPGHVLSYWGSGNFNEVPGLIELENGAKILEASPNVSVDTDITPQVAFWEGCGKVKGYGVINVFNRIHTRVSEIIETFVSIL